MKIYEESFDGHEAAADRYPNASVVMIVDWHKPFTLWQLLRAWWNGRIAVHARRGVREIDLKYEN